MIYANLKIFAVLAALFFLPAAVLASETDGTILAGHQSAWGNQSGWINFGLSAGNIHVTDSGLTGYAWAANQGWINLNPALGGVQNDGLGNLSGSAWGEGLGWINFAHVKIDSYGRFSGTATGTLAGTITFDCSYCDTRTDWRTISARDICGNAIIDNGEECDGAELGGKSCEGFGFSFGSLSCKADCTINTSGCTYSSGHHPPAPATIVIFSGLASPKSTVTLLRDGQIAATAPAETDGNFQITLSGLTGGDYIFTAYSEDSQGNLSSALTLPVSVASGVTANVSGIFIAPTISTDKSEVAQGDNIAIFGQTVPNGQISIVLNSNETYAQIKSDANGRYSYNLDTASLALGQYYVKSKATLGGNVSAFSKILSFTVGNKTIISPPAQKCPGKADLNSDCRVDLVDFSIAAYWYQRPLSDSFKIIEINKLNGDGKIDLVDFSIMAYYWTG
jgi:hypothetical protein